MTRLNLVMLLSVMVTAMAIVHVQYRSRQIFTELDRARNEAVRLDSDNDRLQVEKRAQSTPLRVEKLAKEQLKMRTPTPAITQYVEPDGSLAPGSALPAIVDANPPRTAPGSGRSKPAGATAEPGRPGAQRNAPTNASTQSKVPR